MRKPKTSHDCSKAYLTRWSVRDKKKGVILDHVLFPDKAVAKMYCKIYHPELEPVEMCLMSKRHLDLFQAGVDTTIAEYEKTIRTLQRIGRSIRPSKDTRPYPGS